MEKGKKKREYSVLDKKIENLESRLTPIISGSRKTETTTPYDFVPEKINKEFLFINNLLTAEIASNSSSGFGWDETHHLAQAGRRVMSLQSVLRNWSKDHPTSSFMVSSEPPVCSYTDSCLDEEYDHEEVQKLDHEEKEGLPLVGFKVYQNSEFVGDDDRERLMDFEGLHEEDEREQEEEETVRDDDDDDDTEKRVKNAEKCIPDDTEKRVEIAEKCLPDEQDEIGKFEGISEEEEIIRVIDHKEKKREKAEKGYDDADDYDTNKTHCCFRLVFWVSLIGMGIISVMAGFSDFPDYHSPVVFFTPT